MNMFTATKLQAATYLLGVCLFSVCTIQYFNNDNTDYMNLHSAVKCLLIPELP